MSFPTVLAKIVLAEWLELDSLARLDSAYCNKFDRTKLLGMLRSLRHTFSIEEKIIRSKVSTDFLEWLMKKELKVSNFKFLADIPITLYETFIKYSGSCLQSVELYGAIGDEAMNVLILALAECCPEMVSINAFGCPFPASWNTALKRFSKLTRLTLDCEHAVPDVSIFSEVNLPHLKVVSLFGPDLTTKLH